MKGKECKTAKYRRDSRSTISYGEMMKRIVDKMIYRKKTKRLPDNEKEGLDCISHYCRACDKKEKTLNTIEKVDKTGSDSSTKRQKSRDKRLKEKSQSKLTELMYCLYCSTELPKGTERQSLYPCHKQEVIQQIHECIMAYKKNEYRNEDILGKKWAHKVLGLFEVAVEKPNEKDD